MLHFASGNVKRTVHVSTFCMCACSSPFTIHDEAESYVYNACQGMILLVFRAAHSPSYILGCSGGLAVALVHARVCCSDNSRVHSGQPSYMPGQQVSQACSCLCLLTSSSLGRQCLHTTQQWWPEASIGHCGQCVRRVSRRRHIH